MEIIELSPGNVLSVAVAILVRRRPPTFLIWFHTENSTRNTMFTETLGTISCCSEPNTKIQPYLLNIGDENLSTVMFFNGVGVWAIWIHKCEFGWD
jgi:hypothetical protein